MRRTAPQSADPGECTAGAFGIFPRACCYCRRPYFAALVAPASNPLALDGPFFCQLCAMVIEQLLDPARERATQDSVRLRLDFKELREAGFEIMDAKQPGVQIKKARRFMRRIPAPLWVYNARLLEVFKRHLESDGRGKRRVVSPGRLIVIAYLCWPCGFSMSEVAADLSISGKKVEAALRKFRRLGDRFFRAQIEQVLRTARLSDSASARTLDALAEKIEARAIDELQADADEIPSTPEGEPEEAAAVNA